MTSAHVLPRAEVNDIPHGAVADAVFAGKCAGVSLAIGDSLSNLAHLGFGELPNGDCLATSLPFFYQHVVDVVAACAKEKMRGIDALPVVAGVADKHSGRNWTVVDRIRVAMRQLASQIGILRTASIKRAVSICSETTGPNPTTIRLLDFLPEASGRRSVFRDRREGGASDMAKGGTVGTHFWSLLSRFRGAMPREVAASPGLSRVSIIPVFRAVMGFSGGAA